MRESTHQAESRRALLIAAMRLHDACRLYLRRLGDDGGKSAKLVRASHRELFTTPVKQLAALWESARVDLHGTAIVTAYENASFADTVASFKPLDDRESHHGLWDRGVRKLATDVDALIASLHISENAQVESSLSALQLEVINVLAASEGNTGRVANQLAIRRALAAPGAPEGQWEQVRSVAEAMVPRYFERAADPNSIAYRLTVEGWLRWNRFGDVRRILEVLLAAFRKQFHHALQVTSVSWKDLLDAGATAGHHHIAATAGSIFFHLSQPGANGESSTFGCPIDIDEVLSCEDVDEFIAYRRRTSFARAVFRNEQRKELTHDTRRAIDLIFQSFTRRGTWPWAREVDVQFRRAGISLRQVCQSPFVRGAEVERDGAVTYLTLAGLGACSAAGDDRADVLALMRHLGVLYQRNPSARVVSTTSVGEELGLDQVHIRYLASLLSESAALLISYRGEPGDAAEGVIHLAPNQQDYIEAETFEDILFADYQRRTSYAADLLAARGVMSWDAATPSVERDDHVEVAHANAAPSASIRDDSHRLSAPLVLLGGGAYGQVYRTRDDLDRDIAVKFLRASREEQASIEGHAKAMAKAKHRSMVTLYDIWNLVDPATGILTRALVMELLEGDCLEHFPGPFTHEQAGDFSQTLLSFLRKVHDAGTHHGDLHGKNVMITDEGLRILDPYHRNSQVALSTRTAESWRRQDVIWAQCLINEILIKTADADKVAAAFRHHKPRMSTLDELAEAIRIAFGR